MFNILPAVKCPELLNVAPRPEQSIEFFTLINIQESIFHDKQDFWEYSAADRKGRKQGDSYGFDPPPKSIKVGFPTGAELPPGKPPPRDKFL